MKRVRPGECFVIEGLWMRIDEAALVKQELLARKTKQAERLALAIGFPSREWQSGSSFDEGDGPVQNIQRNCERFRTWQEAKAAFWREVGDPADWQRLLEWLYATDDGTYYTPPESEAQG